MNVKTNHYIKNYGNFTDVLKVLNEEKEVPFYVDKTLFLKHILICPYSILFILKPHRSGKSFNLSMLKYFFSIDETKEYSEQIISNFKIKESKTLMEQNFRKYPVIFIDLSLNIGINIESILRKIRVSITKAFLNHYYLVESEGINDYEKQKFKENCDENNKMIDFAESIKFLCKVLKKHYKTYNKNVYVLIDDYDSIPNSLLEHYSQENDFEKKKFIISLFIASSELISQIICGCSKNNEYLEKLIVFGINNIIPVKDLPQINNFKILNSVNDFFFNDDFGLFDSEVNQLIKALRIEGDEKKIIEGNIANYINSEFYGYFNIYNKRSFPVNNVYEFLIKYYFLNVKKNAFEAEIRLPLILDEIFSIYDERFSKTVVSLLINAKVFFETNLTNKSLEEFINVSNVENIYRTIFLNNYDLRVILLINYGVFTVIHDTENTNKDLLLIPNNSMKKYVVERFLKWEYPIIDELEDFPMKLSLSLDEDEIFLFLIKSILKKIDKNLVSNLNDIYIQSLVGLSIEKYALSLPPNDRYSYFSIYSNVDEKSKSNESVFDSNHKEKPIVIMRYKIYKKDNSMKDLQSFVDDLFFESIVQIFYKKVLSSKVIKTKNLLIRVLVIYQEDNNKWSILTQTFNINYLAHFHLFSDFVMKNESIFELLRKSQEYESAKLNIMKLNEEFLKHQFTRKKCIITTPIHDDDLTNFMAHNFKKEIKNDDFSLLNDLNTNASNSSNCKVKKEISSKNSFVINVSPPKDEERSSKEYESEDTDDSFRKDYFYKFIKNCSSMNKLSMIQSIYKLLENNENIGIGHFKNLGLKKVALRILEDEQTNFLHKKFWELKKNNSQKNGETQSIQNFFLKHKRKRYEDK